MNHLCDDVLHKICSYLTGSEEAMLSITNKQFARCINRKQSLLFYFIQDSNLNWIKLAQKWHCKWRRQLYGEMGSAGNIDVFKEVAFTRSLFMGTYCSLDEESIAAVYEGAAYADKTDLMKYIDANYKGCYYYIGAMRYAAVSRQYKSIDYLLVAHHDTAANLAWAAVECLDAELIQYCHKNGVPYKTSLGGLPEYYFSLEKEVVQAKPLTAELIADFIVTCKSVGRKFKPITIPKTPEILFGLAACGLCDIRKNTNKTWVDWLCSSHGRLDWSNPYWKRFIFNCVKAIFQNDYPVRYYFKLKKFLKQELTYEQYNEVKLVIKKQQ